MIGPAIWVLSFSSLMAEVILARVFAITQWHHLTFMVISISLFGFAASGTFLCLVESRKNNITRWFAGNGPVMGLGMAFSLSLVFCFAYLGWIPLDYFRLPVSPVQGVYLFTVFFVFSLPFFIAGLTISVGFAALPEKTGWIYFLTMTGSAAGALFPGMGLSFFSEEKLILLAAGLPLIALVLAYKKPANNDNTRSDRVLRHLMMSLTVLFMALFFMPQAKNLLKATPSSYKGLSQALVMPDTRTVLTKTGIRGRLDLVKSPHLRFAPGLSLTYPDAVDTAGFVFRDGDSMYGLYSIDKNRKGLFPEFMLSWAGYLSAPERKNILVIPRNGGTAIAGAIAAGSRNIVVLEQNPDMAAILRPHYGFTVVQESPRAYLASSDRLFDIIHIEAWGSSIPGAGALNQDPLLTVQGLFQCMDHLTSEGVLMVSRKLLLPPANTIRMWATARQALLKKGIKDPNNHLAILRNWDTFILVATLNPFRKTAPLEGFANKMNFDRVYMPGMKKKMANQFNMFDRPFHFEAIAALENAFKKNGEDDFFAGYTLDVSPLSDNRPFPDRLVKVSRIKALYQSTGQRLYALLLSGEIVVWVVFLEALAISLALAAIAFAFVVKKEKNRPVAMGLFFLFTGAGFMFTELFYIKKIFILFEDPVISLVLVLSGLLVFSGLGGVLSLYLNKNQLSIMVILVVAVLAGALAGMDTMVEQVLEFSKPGRVTAAFFLMLPPGVLLGFPFAMGMRYLPETPAQRAFAWSLNGSASVLSSIAAAQIALSFGISALLMAAMAAYALSFISLILFPLFPRKL